MTMTILPPQNRIIYRHQKLTEKLTDNDLT